MIRRPSLAGFALFIALFAALILIAVYVEGGWVRTLFGDFLVVGLLHTGLRTFLRAAPSGAAIAAISIAFGIEILQALNVPEALGLADHPVARVVVGSTFDPRDLVMYVLGGLFAFVIDRLVVARTRRQWT